MITFGQASTNTRGTFTQGTTGTSILRLASFDGAAIDPDYINYDIINNSSGVYAVNNGIPYKATDGLFVFDWCIPIEQPIGPYTVNWNYIIEGNNETETENIIVAQSTGPNTYYSGYRLLFRESLVEMIKQAQFVPIYNQPAKRTRDNQTFHWTKNNWNQVGGTSIYVNNQLQNSGYLINFQQGSVTFNNPLLDVDVVKADYNFRWFTDNQLDTFLNNSVGVLNNYPPVTFASIGAIGQFRYIPIVRYGAAVDALRALMLALAFREPQELFGGRDAGKSSFDMLSTLKEDYEKTWQGLLDIKKYGPYTGLTREVVVPEYTLPGGRCLTPYSISSYVIMGCRKTMPLWQAFNMLNKGIKLKIETEKNGRLSFSPVYKIWQSGRKQLWRITGSNGMFVKTSDEHLFKVNGSFIPLSEIKIRDELTISDSSGIKKTNVKSIKKAETDYVFDLEVPETQNLFANGINCHNSRWFRMLFSTTAGS